MNVRLFCAMGIIFWLVETIVAADPVTDRIENFVLKKDQTSASFTLSCNTPDPYLWIRAHARDNQPLEHGAGRLRLELNGVVLDEKRSVLQDLTFNTPLSPSWRYATQKYDPRLKAWAFRFDKDFVMNNQNTGPSDSYFVTNYHHWYAFNVKDLAVQGTNQITLTEQITQSSWKSKYYEGFFVGELVFCSLDEVKQKISAYDALQTVRTPKQPTWEALMKSTMHLEPPPGKPQQFAVAQGGYITRDQKPFFLCYLNAFNPFFGREALLNIYNYYSLINVVMAGNGATAREVMDLPIYLKEDWDKTKVEPWEIGQLLGLTWVAYDQGLLALPYIVDNQGGLAYLERNHPELFVCYSNGDHAHSPEGGGFMPNYTHPSYQEYIRQMTTVLGGLFRGNPGIFGYSLWEELGFRFPQTKGRMAPQSPDDLKRFQAFLREKYKSIQTLNSEWGTDHSCFENVVFPEWREQTANFANYQQWRAEGIAHYTRTAYQALKQADPGHLVMGQKMYTDIGHSMSYGPPYAIDNWAITEWTDVSREFSADFAMAQLGRSACARFNKVMEADICFAADAYRRREEPSPWINLLDQKARAAYPYFMDMLFNGNKSFHWEIYDLGYGADFHFVHYAKRWKSLGKDWSGKNLGFDDSGPADVILPEKTLQMARLQQWIIRNAALILPARVAKPQVAVLTSIPTRWLGYDPLNKLANTKRVIPGWDPTNVGHDFDHLGALFNHLHLKFDCVDEREIDAIFGYKVLIVGYQANVGNERTAQKIKDYVKQGGTVIFYPEAFSWRDVDFKDLPESPGYGLSDLSFVNINHDEIITPKGIKLADTRFIPGMKEGDAVCETNIFAVRLNPKPGAVTLAVAEDGTPLLVSDPDGKSFYFGCYLGLAYFQNHPRQEQFARLVEGILERAGVEKPVELELKGNVERRLVVPGLMAGKGYWLAGVNNFSGENQAMTLRIHGLPNDKYEVVDISGESPVMARSEDGNYHLKPDFEDAQPKCRAAKIKAKKLALDGVEVTIPQYYSKVWLIRPAGESAWVNSTTEALISYVEMKKPLKVVVGHGCNGDEQKQAEELRKLLEKKGVTAAVVKDNEIKTKVVEGKLTEDGYELEKYRHEVIDDEADLILIGNADENRLVKHLQTAGNYAYCKVPEMVTADYPGKGRGIIQIAECVNTISYDATDKSRDAIILAGSDRKGTRAAVEKYIKLISK